MVRPANKSFSSPAGETLELPLDYGRPRVQASRLPLEQDLRNFRDFGQATKALTTPWNGNAGVATYVNEFWTAKQRQANSLHEISYRACFKPQLPRFFIERLSEPGDIVYDPFMGRGTTAVEAALLGRVPFGNDINPVSRVMTLPRLRPPTMAEIEGRLNEIDWTDTADAPEDLLVFYHPDTLQRLSALKQYFLQHRRSGTLDRIDEWLEMVSLNRLTGHSNGFFSVYTLPPNQAVSVKSQRKINEKRRQVPPVRDVKKILLKKTKQLLGDVDTRTRERLAQSSAKAVLVTGAAHATPAIQSNTVRLVVTSPPFLNVVQYATDNWLRCWFLGIDANSVKLTVPRGLETWQTAMTEVFQELGRVLKPGGHVAFEVGEVHGGKTRLEETVLPCGSAAGLKPVLILINDQKFTKTANCWGVDNMAKGTNTNRVVVFQKPA